MRSAAHSEQHGVKGDSDGVAASCLTGLRHARVGDRTSQWSGVAALTLMPAMARTAGHVTMLQRSPSYVITLPQRDDRHRAAATLRTGWLIGARGGSTSQAAAGLRAQHVQPEAGSAADPGDDRTSVARGYPIVTVGLTDVHRAPVKHSVVQLGVRASERVRRALTDPRRPCRSTDRRRTGRAPARSSPPRDAVARAGPTRRF